MTLDALALQELKASIAERLFIQVASWHLYLGDAGLAETLAIECAAHLDKGASVAARNAVESVQPSTIAIHEPSSKHAVES